METEGMIEVKPISVRKLKKYYIIRSTCYYFLTSRYSTLYMYVPKNVMILHYPSIFINKKFVESQQTYISRYVDCKFDKVVIKSSASLEFLPSAKKITLYAAFNSENDYLKWKLKV